MPIHAATYTSAVGSAAMSAASSAAWVTFVKSFAVSQSALAACDVTTTLSRPLPSHDTALM